MLGEVSVTLDNAMSLWAEEPVPAKHLSPMRETASALAPEDCSRSRFYAAKQRGRSRWLPDGSRILFATAPTSGIGTASRREAAWKRHRDASDPQTRRPSRLVRSTESTVPTVPEFDGRAPPLCIDARIAEM